MLTNKTMLCAIVGCCFALLVDSSHSINQSNWTSSTEADVHGHTESDTSGPSNQFVKEIFNKYGHNGVITLEGLEHLLENLGLGNLDFGSDHGISEHKKVEGPNVTFVSIHDPGHSHSPSDQEDEHHQHHHIDDDHAHVQQNNKQPSTGADHKLVDAQPKQKAPKSSSQSVAADNQSLVIIREKCLNTTEILLNINANPDQPNISVDNFLYLCPIIVYELDQQHCRFGPTHHNPNYHHEHHHEHNNNSSFTTKTSSKSEEPVYYVWFYSSVAVLIISISGMMCVAIIPIIQRCFYQQLIQYLVALAIGSLTGDALLHLLPHAMTSVMSSSSGGGDGDDHGHNHGNGDHSQSVWIGLMALCGICLFFTAEQGLNALNSWKSKRDGKKRAPVGSLKVGDVELRKTVGDKLSKQEYNSYGYQYEEVSTEMLKVDGDNYSKLPMDRYEKPVDETEKSLLNGSNVTMPVIHIKDDKENLEKDISSPLFHSTHSYHDNPEHVDIEHASAAHHGHGHSHSHTVPATAMATAWMVIAGDGLHNFSDGMAIGAAFSNGLTGGLSTSIAVFCHELPHELGDFALLLKAGMSIRQGLFYNGLSSVLCFLGMVVGLAIGNIQSANAWVFAGAAGMFLYIALVDMVPELHSGNGSSGSSLGRFIIQALGIATGISIMCVIALYEEDLQKTLDTE